MTTINMIFSTLIFSCASYLVGSVNWSIIISRFFFNEDVRNTGSGNAGATNVVRSHGKKIGAIVMFLDTTKTIIAMGIAMSFKRTGWGFFERMHIQTIGLFAIVGHVYPIFFNFKGGKGASTLLGYIIAFEWWLFFVGVVVFLAIVKKIKIVSIASMVSPVVLFIIFIISSYVPPLSHSWSIQWFYNEPAHINIICLAIAITFVIFAHRSNIIKIINGKENKFVK